VLTWHGQQKATKALLHQCCVPFIDRVLMALQKVQATSISVSASHVSAREGSFKLQALLGLPPLSLVDMLHVTGGFQWISGSLTSM